MSNLRARFLALAAAASQGDNEAAAAETSAPSRAARAGSSATTALPAQLSASLRSSGLASSRDVVDLLTRSSSLLRLSAVSHRASAGRAPVPRAGISRSGTTLRLDGAGMPPPSAGNTRIRMETLGARLMALETMFDMQAYGLGISNAQRRPGGVTIAYDFYSRLFAAQKQLGTKLTRLTAELAERADGTMSYGELTFMLKDFKVLPQLISRSELLFILSQRTLGKQLRRRREQYDLSVSLLAQEEEALERDRKAAQVLPDKFTTSFVSPPPAGISPLNVDRRIHALSPMQLRPGEGDEREILSRIQRRQERVRQLRSAVASFEVSMLDPATQVEARMEHGSYELSFTEYLEVLVRVALFAFSKPALAASDVGRQPAAAGQPSARPGATSSQALTSASAATAGLPRSAALAASNAPSMIQLAMMGGSDLDLTATHGSGAPESAFARTMRQLAARSALQGYDDIADTPEFKVIRLLRYMGLDNPSATRRVVLTVGAATQQYLNATPGMADPSRKSFAGRSTAGAPPKLGVGGAPAATELASAAGGVSINRTKRSGSIVIPAAVQSEQDHEDSAAVQAMIDAAASVADAAAAALQASADADGAPQVAGPTGGGQLGRHASLQHLRRMSTTNVLDPMASLVSQTESAPVADTHAAIEHHHHVRVGQWVQDSAGNWIATHYAMPVAGLHKPAGADGSAEDGTADTGAGAGAGPEVCIGAQYSNVLCDLVRRFEYDTVSPVFRSYGGPFIDCGTLAFAHRNSAMAVGAADAQQQVFRYRLSITNECTDVLALSVLPRGLPSGVFTLRVVETRSSVSITAAASAAAKAVGRTTRAPLARGAHTLQRNGGPFLLQPLTHSLSGSKSMPSFPRRNAATALLATGRLGQANADGDDATVPPGHRSPSRVAGHVSSMAMSSAAAAAGLLGSSADITGGARWHKVGLSVSVDPVTGAVSARDLAPGLSLVIELVVVPPEFPGADGADDGFDAIPVLSARRAASDQEAIARGEVLGDMLVTATSVTGEHQNASIPVYAKFDTGAEHARAPDFDERGGLEAEPEHSTFSAAEGAEAYRLRRNSESAGSVSPRRSITSASISASPVARMRAPMIKRGDSFQDLSSGSRRHSRLARDIADDADAAAVASGTMFDSTVRARLDSYASEFPMRRSESVAMSEFELEGPPLIASPLPVGHAVRMSYQHPLNALGEGRPSAFPARSDTRSALDGTAGPTSSRPRLGGPRRENLRVHALQFSAGVDQLEAYLSRALDTTVTDVHVATDEEHDATILATSASGLSLTTAPLGAVKHAAATIQAPRHLSVVKKYRLPITSAALLPLHAGATAGRL